MWELFISLFVGMDWLVITLLSIGVVLIVIEIFVPGFGVFGIMGILSTIGGIIARVVGKGLSAVTIVAYVGYLIILVGVVSLIAFGIMVWSAKKGLLSRTSIFSNSTALPAGHTAGTPDYSFLVGKIGSAITDLNPGGKIVVDAKTYSVISNGEYVYSNTPVKVVSCEGAKIVVKKFIKDQE